MKKNDMENLENELNSFFKKNSLLFGVEDKYERRALPKEDGLKNFAGGSARKISPKETKTSMKDLAEKFEDEYKIFSSPLTNEKNKEVIKVVEDLTDMFFLEKDNTKRVKNGAQAIVRNPILRGDYGRNTATAEKNKGFNRLMIDTGQFFNSIIADVGE